MIRLFTAVPVPADIREKIAEMVFELKSFNNLPEGIRFVPPENLHITLTFLGSQPELVVPDIEELLVEDFNLEVEFEKLIYGPPGGRPRMIWLLGTKETSEKLGKIKNKLEDEFEDKGIEWSRGRRPYNAHLTLARFPQISVNRLPSIEKKIDWKYKTGEVQLMKSTLERTGAKYEVL